MSASVAAALSAIALSDQPETSSSFSLILAERQRQLLTRVKMTPKQAMSLRRNKYRVIRRITRELKWDIAKDKDATMVWLDKWEMADLTNLRHYKVGHFPGMWGLGSKCNLGRTLNRIRQEFPTDYDYFPLSFCLPADKDKLLEFDANYRAVARKAKSSNNNSNNKASSSSSLQAFNGALGHPNANPGGYPLLAPPTEGCWPAPGSQPQPQPVSADRVVYIVKPDAGSRGQGIYLALGLEGIEELHMDEEEEEDTTPSNGPSSRTTSGGNRTSTTRPSSAGNRRSVNGDTDNDDDDDDEEENAEKFVMVQAYLPRPLLMDGRKFDLRIYVLVTSVYPTLRVFIYRQGLVRFATEQYYAPDESNVAKRRMFLTNYAVNKPGERPRSPKTGIDDVPESARPKSTKYDVNPAGGADDNGDDDTESDGETPTAGSGSGSGGGGGGGGGRKPAIPPRPESVDIIRARVGCKWTISTLLECMEAQGVDTDQLWERVKDVIFKTILAVRPSMAQKYKAARPALKKEAPPPMEVPKVKRRIPRPLYTRTSSTGSSGSGATGEGNGGADLSSSTTTVTGTVPESPRTPTPPTPISLSVSTLSMGSTTNTMELPAGTNTATTTTIAASTATSRAAAALGAASTAMVGGVGFSSSSTTSRNMVPGSSTSAGIGGIGLPINGGNTAFGRATGTKTGGGINSGRQQSLDSSGGNGAFGLSGLGLFGTAVPITTTKGAANNSLPKASGNTLALPRSASVGTGLTTTSSASAAGMNNLLKSRLLLGPSPILALESGPTLSSATEAGIHIAGLATKQQAIAAAAAAASAAAIAATASLTTSSSSSAAAASSTRSTSANKIGSGGGDTTPDNMSIATSVTMSIAVDGGGGEMSPSVISSTSSTSTPSRKPPTNTSSSSSTPSRTNKPPFSTGGSISSNSNNGHASAELLALEEEDGEQGFRAYELMGLDVILDMSHCICSHTHEHVRLSSDPKKWKKMNSVGKKRCQPRPVLLEINQSCSLHSDSDLDKIVKGDVVTDAFTLSSPDDKWLLEQFAETIRVGGGLAAIAATQAETIATGGGSSSGSGSGSGESTPSTITTTATTIFTPSPPIAPSIICAPDLVTAVETAEAALKDPKQDPRTTKKTFTNTIVDDRCCLNDISPIVHQAVALSRSSLEESSALLYAFRKGFPAAISTKRGGSGSASATPADENKPPSSVSTTDASLTTLAPAAPLVSAPTALAPSSVVLLPSDVIPWIPSPEQSLYALLQEVWRQEMWFGQRWYERDTAEAAALHNTMLKGLTSSSVFAANAMYVMSESINKSNNGGAGKTGNPNSGSGSFGNVISTVLALRRAQSVSKIESSSSSGTGERGSNSSNSSALSSSSSSSTPPAWSLGTVPQLSTRAQVVLLLRRLYEASHMGGFERVSPPPHPQLAERYRRIAEYVPPAMRETFAFAKRRLEALAMRAGIEAKRNSGFRL